MLWGVRPIVESIGRHTHDTRRRPHRTSLYVRVSRICQLLAARTCENTKMLVVYEYVVDALIGCLIPEERTPPLFATSCVTRWTSLPTSVTSTVQTALDANRHQNSCCSVTALLVLRSSRLCRQKRLQIVRARDQRRPIVHASNDFLYYSSTRKPHQRPLKSG